MSYQEFFGVISLVLSVLTYVPYIKTIFQGVTHPHMFMWFSWGLFSLIVFAVQVSENAGPGAWVNFFAIVANFYIAYLALTYGEKNITWTDKLSLAAVFICIPLWLITNNPLSSLLVLCVVDICSFWPTYRKS